MDPAPITHYGSVSVQRPPPIEPECTEEDIPDSEVLAHLPADTSSLDLPHFALVPSSLSDENLHLSRFTSLVSLCLRQNKLDSLPADVFEKLPALVDLDLYDNQLGSEPQQIADALRNCVELVSLDLSFNTFTSVPNFTHLPRLEKLYLVQNKITTLDTPLPGTLTMIELGGNRLRSLGNLGEECTNLTELWLGKNKITSLLGLDKLTKLTLLSLQSNRLTEIHGLDNMTELVEVYFSHNGLTSLEKGLENNLKLHTLDVSSNYITSFAGISHLKDLRDLWASYNQIPNLRSIAQELGNLKNLETLYLEGNPAQKFEATGYRRKLILELPWLKQIDAT